jgi:membrane protein YqaA with SNARE-associated domain
MDKHFTPPRLLYRIQSENCPAYLLPYAIPPYICPQSYTTLLYKFLAVAGLATFEGYAAIITGFAMQMSPWSIALASIVGGLIGAFVAAFLGERIRLWISRYRKPKKAKEKTGLVYRIWEKYGLIGLGLLGTMTVGVPISMAVGVGFNVSLRQLLFWCCLGVLLRSVLITFLGHTLLHLF